MAKSLEEIILEEELSKSNLNIEEVEETKEDPTQYSRYEFDSGGTTITFKTSDNNFDSVDTTERGSQETGVEASLIEGSNLNKKITFKEDLDKIQVLLEVQN